MNNLIGRLMVVMFIINGCNGTQLGESQGWAHSWVRRRPEQVSALNTQDISRLFKSIHYVLPHYIKTFKSAALRYRLPWQLVAAVAYQESHWTSDARSFTGVRGFMQLTEETADHMDVEDRNDPYQSIRGGTKYLRYLLDKQPSFVNPRDRLNLTLAAYNIGFGHLRDAQKLAERLGRNPYSWKELKDVVLLLADPQYSQELEFGPARGYETVEFVDRVKTYFDLIKSAR